MIAPEGRHGATEAGSEGIPEGMRRVAKLLLLLSIQKKELVLYLKNMKMMSSCHPRA